MSFKIKEMMQERAQLVANARELLTKAEGEKRDLNEAENATYEQIMKDVASLKARIDRATALEEEERQLAENAYEPHRPDPERRSGNQPSPDDEQRAAAWMSFIARGPHGLRGEEARALQMDLDASGGYLVAPGQWRNQLIQAVDNLVYMRVLASVLPPTSSTLGAPSLETDIGDLTWTAELAMGNEDSSMAFGQRELSPHPMARYIKVSKKLLKAGAINVDSLVRQRLAYKIATVQENAFLNGTGANQPLGIMVASDDGISTSRDVSTDMETTAITAKGLLNCYYGLKPQYRRTAVWMFHTDAVLQIAKLVDGESRFIWQPGLVQGQQDTIKGRPVYESAYMPNTFTTGQYVGAFGDMKAGYWIVDAPDVEIQIGDELYMLTNQRVYTARMETDGMPVLEEAFVRVTLA